MAKGLDKQQCIELTKQYGIYKEGDSYNNMMKAIATYEREHKVKEENKKEFGGREAAKEIDYNKEIPITEFEKTDGVIIAPEIKTQRIQLMKYDEVLGEETPKVVEVDSGMLADRYRNEDYTYKYASYDKIGVSKKPNIAQSTLPRQNPEISFDPHIDKTAVVRFGNQKGYIWKKLPVSKLPDGKTLYLPGVQDLLDRFPEYKDSFRKKEMLFYIGTTKLCADIDYTHAVLNEIQAKEKERSRLGLKE